MQARRTYLDHNASAPLRPEARAAALAALDVAGNPSSVHREGRAARAVIEKARSQVAALVNAKPEEVIFTSGGTEANAWAVGGEWDSVLVSKIEHASVLAPALRAKARRCFVDVDRDGAVAFAYLATLLGPDAGRALVSIQAANNETGVVQNVATVASFARERGAVSHTDAVQAVGKIPVDFTSLGADYMSLSAHKIGGPKGVGALIARTGERLFPLLTGGAQERRRRAGTENVAGIAGFGAAAKAALVDLEGMGRIARLRDRLEHEARRLAPETVVIGEDSPRLPNTSCLALAGTRSETAVIFLDLAGVAVSAGAACSSGKVSRSHVLDAMRVEETLANAAVRVSLGWNSSEADVDAFLSAWGAFAAKRGFAHGPHRQSII